MNLYLIMVNKISLVQVLAKEKKFTNFTINPKGLDILIKKCYEKGEYSSKFACLSTIKLSGVKKIKDDYLKIKQNILKEKERFFEKVFKKHLEEKVFKDIIEKNIYRIFTIGT